MKKGKTIKLKVRKTNRFTYVKHQQVASSSDSTVSLTTTLTGYPN